MSSGGSLVGEYRVQVYLYDLSHGMARALSQGFLGKQIDGIWHTGLVVFGSEYYFGGGIQASRPGGTMAGQPGQVIDIGYTRLPPETFHEFLRGVAHRFTAETYSLLDWNCNNFTNECSLFLTGLPIPSFITGLPAEALATPFGQMLRPMIAQMEGQMRGGGGGGGIPWGAGGQLQLPPATARPDRMVDSASNPEVPHNVVESAAAIAAGAIAQTTPSNLPTAVPAPAAAAASAAPVAAATPAAASASSATNLIRVTPGRVGGAKLLTSVDKKARSFHVLLKSNAKKVVSTGLSPEDDATLVALVTALSEDGLQVSPAGVALIESFVTAWPAALQFPVLGLLRLLVLRPECAEHYADTADKLVASLRRLLPNEDGDSTSSSATTNTVAPPNAQAMALCTLANLLTHSSLRRLSESSEVWSAVRVTASVDNLTVRLMSSTLAFNASSLLTSGDADVAVEALTFVSESLKSESTSEVVSRLLLTLAELTFKHSSLASLLVGLDFTPELDVLKTKFPHDAQLQATIVDLGAILEAAQAAAFQVE